MDLHIAAPHIWATPWLHTECLGHLVVRHDDPLGVGPLVQGLDRLWLRRLTYRHDLGAGECTHALPLWHEDLRTAVERTGRVWLWLTDHLDDQLFAALYTSELAALGVPRDRVGVALAGSLMNSVGLAGASWHERPHDGEPLVCRALESAEWDALQRCWQAVTSPTPDALLAFLADDGRAGLPRRGSIRALLGHYLSRTSGLDVWEELLLEKLARWSPEAVKSAMPIGSCLGEHADAVDQPGDLWMFRALLGLDQVGCRAPLVESTGERIAMRFVTLRLTELGRDVLEGRACHLEHNAIDRQVGGVHLDSAAGRVWLRDGATLVPWTR